MNISKNKNDNQDGKGLLSLGGPCTSDISVPNDPDEKDEHKGGGELFLNSVDIEVVCKR